MPNVVEIIQRTHRMLLQKIETYSAAPTLLDEIISIANDVFFLACKTCNQD